MFNDGVDFIEIPEEQLADASQADRIEFDVKVTVYSPETESLAKVCLIERNGQKGIGVYVSLLRKLEPKSHSLNTIL